MLQFILNTQVVICNNFTPYIHCFQLSFLTVFTRHIQTIPFPITIATYLFLQLVCNCHNRRQYCYHYNAGCDIAATILIVSVRNENIKGVLLQNIVQKTWKCWYFTLVLLFFGKLCQLLVAKTSCVVNKTVSYFI